MTNNQINYARLNEDRRHNSVTEVETARHNRRQEDVGFYTGGAAYAGVAENARHNREQESINWYTAENLGNLQSAQATKTQSEVGVESAKQSESARHNEATERQAMHGQDETNRHNRITEQQTDRSLGIQTWNAVVNTVDKAGEVAKDVSTALKNFGALGGAAGVMGLFK